MKHMDFKIIDRKRAWDGYCKIDVYHLQHDKFDGGQSPVLQREVLERGHAVAVLPYDPIRDEVVLIEQFRPGTISVNASSSEMPVWLTEIVAGIIEDGESAEDVARRETIEEAGCEIIGSLDLISHYYVTPGCSSETVTLYCGQVDASNVGGLHGLAEEGEDIRVFTVPAEECFAMLHNGQLCNAMTTIAVQWLMLNRSRLRQKSGV